MNKRLGRSDRAIPPCLPAALRVSAPPWARLSPWAGARTPSRAAGAGQDSGRLGNITLDGYRMRSLAPIKLPGFSHLAGAYAVNELGNWIGEIALAVLVYDQTGSPLATAALFLGMQFAPGFLGQVLVARVEPAGTKRMLPLLYLAEAATFVALAATVDNFALWLVVRSPRSTARSRSRARAFTRAAGGGGADATRVAARGQRDHQRRLHRPPGRIGPLLAGVVVATLGIETALLLDAASFVLVAAVLAAATSLPQVKAQPEPLAGASAGGVRLREQPAGAAPADDDAGRRVRVLQRWCCRSRSCTRRRRSTPANSGYGALLVGMGRRHGVRQPGVRWPGRRVPMGLLLFYEHARGRGSRTSGWPWRGTLAVACAAACPGRRRQRRAVGGGDEHRPGTHRRAVPGTGRRGCSSRSRWRCPASASCSAE